ncbi:hypothetical protein BRC77_05285 [Halobacteriales archaeon QH_8_64_26]|jgi:hypothetical protein|nr:MAG: hypothetical protein BRC77_05285 [Halobacteriales archaeon QH_8_64_26]
MTRLVIYCMDCEWSASTEDHSRSDQSVLAIDHHVATGHTIESTRRERGEPAEGWAEEWPPTE